MSHSANTTLLLAACLGTALVVRPAAALQQEHESGASPDSTYDAKILFFPALGSMPETGFFFGGVAIPQFKIGSSHADTRSSSILLSALYTLKNQVLISVVPEMFTADDSWALSGAYSGNYFPQDFWGVGPDTPDSARVKVVFTSLAAQQSVLRRIGRRAFVGPFLRWTNVSNIRFERDGEEVPSPNVSGASGSTTAGLGIAARLDRRTSVMTPVDHWFVGVIAQVYPSFLGTTHPFTGVDMDARRYLNLSGDGRSVLAFQATAAFRTGDPAFYDLAQLGGDEIGRGYYEGRYRDNNAMAIQTEWRRSVRGRVGVTLFTSLGRVWERFDDLDTSHLRPAVGAGLRINVNKADPTNLRIDFGVGRESTGFYMQFGEAF